MTYTPVRTLSASQLHIISFNIKKKPSHFAKVTLHDLTDLHREIERLWRS